MQDKDIETIESNHLVPKYQGDIFRINEVDYSPYLDKKTLKEHLRQISRLK
jgi:hypothetical protein